MADWRSNIDWTETGVLIALIAAVIGAIGLVLDLAVISLGRRAERNADARVRADHEYWEKKEALDHDRVLNQYIAEGERLHALLWEMVSQADGLLPREQYQFRFHAAEIYECARFLGAQGREPLQEGPSRLAARDLLAVAEMRAMSDFTYPSTWADRWGSSLRKVERALEVLRDCRRVKTPSA